MLRPGHVKLLFPHTCHENWQTVHCTHKNWQTEELLKNLPIYLLGCLCFSATNVATELRACLAHTALSLLTSPQLDCLRTWPSVSRCLLNSEGPPKGPSSFVAIQITSHRDWPMSWRRPSIGRINGGRWRHDPLRLTHVHANKGSEAQPCKEHFGQQRPLERPSLPHRAAFNGYHCIRRAGHLLRAGVC